MRVAVSIFNGEGGKNMNKKLITMLVTFCFMLLLAPVSVMAATPTNAPIVIDVGGANVENENYKIFMDVYASLSLSTIVIGSGCGIVCIVYVASTFANILCSR